MEKRLRLGRRYRRGDVFVGPYITVSASMVRQAWVSRKTHKWDRSLLLAAEFLVPEVHGKAHSKVRHGRKT